MLEEREFQYLGVALAQMPWLELHSEVQSFRDGVTAGKGKIHHMDESSLYAYDGLIYYKLPARTKIHRTPEPIVILLDNLVRLQRFVSLAMTDLYDRGIIE